VQHNLGVLLMGRLLVLLEKLDQAAKVHKGQTL